MRTRLTHQILLYKRTEEKDRFGTETAVYKYYKETKGSISDREDMAGLKKMPFAMIEIDRINIYIKEGADIKTGDCAEIYQNGIYKIIKVRQYKTHTKLIGERWAGFDS